MLRAKAISLFFSILACFAHLAIVNAQSVAAALQPGEPVERTIARGEAHAFSIRLDRDQFLQVVVDQRGIDVVVRLFAPDGKRLGEVDSPNGTSGPEGLSLVARAPGLYRIEVTPLGQDENTVRGRYEIRILDLRPATREELESADNREVAKDKGIALLVEAAEALQQIRLPETRVRAQIQAAQLLRTVDEKRARRLVEEAIAGVQEYLASVASDDPNYYQRYQTAVQLRSELIQVLAIDDPDLALSFLRSTRVLSDPNARPGGGQESQELQLELALVNRIIAKDPKRALQTAQQSLTKGYAYNLIETLNQLQRADPESAARLAEAMFAKLQGENLLSNQTAANLAGNLLQLARPTVTNGQTAPASAGTSVPPLLNERQYRELFTKALTAALTYMPPAANFYSAERNAALNLLSLLRTLTTEMEKYAPGKAPALEKALAELNTPPDPQSRLLQRYQETINNTPISQALEALGQAPEEVREQLYQQAATKAAATGDLELAKQILGKHLTNPYQRQQAMKNLDQQAVYNAINGGKLAEA
jgi:hypothetical protein